MSAADTGEVGLGFLRPVVLGRVVPGRVVLQMAGPDQCQSFETVEVLAAGLSDVEQRLLVPQPLREIHPDPAQGVDAVYKAVEVQHYEVVDGDAKVLLDGFYQVVRAVLAV